MAQNQIVIGIDLSKTHLRVGGLVDKIVGRYIVIQGSKDAKVDGNKIPGRGELVMSYRDAHEVVKSSMGDADIQAATVVVPNATPSRNRDAIAFLGRSTGARNPNMNVVEVISEYTAVAAAYADKLKPNKGKTLVVVSTTGGIIDVSVVNVKPQDLLRDIYEFNLEAQETHLEPIDFEKLELQRKQAELDGKLTGIIPVVGPLIQIIGKRMDEARDILKNILKSPKLSNTSSVDVVVFVGNVPTPNLLQKEVKTKYPNAKVWDDIDVDEVAAYGGAVVAFDKTKPPTEVKESTTTTTDHDNDDDDDDVE